MGPERTPLEGFPVASLRINELMPLLLDLVTASWDTLAAGLKVAQPPLPPPR